MHAARPVDFSRSGPYFIGLLLVTLVAFWPSYLSKSAPASSAYTHFHAFTASVWMLMLIAQPIAIRARRMALHRLLGRLSYAIAPLVLLSMILLAHHRIRIAGAGSYAIQTYVLYLQVLSITLFGLSYALAVYNRHAAAVHARFMVCTALTLIDPVVVRLMFRFAPPDATWNFQWLTYGLTDLVLVALILIERRSRAGRAVFPSMLAVFMIAQAPALFGWTKDAWWQSFARWFASLPLT
jgi:hypothetical protein